MIRFQLRLKLGLPVLGFSHRCRLINPLEITGDRFTHFSTDIVQAIAHQMDDAELDGGSGVNRFNRFRKAFQPIHTRLHGCRR
jgi:hypothetical protein